MLHRYHALNRSLTFSHENADGTRTVITADYDYMGRCVYKKGETVTPAAPDSEYSGDSDTPTETRTILTHHRYLYRGYLQIATLDLTRTTLNDLWLITWDPTETVATRPLAIQKDGTWYTYGRDLPKNITEIYGFNGYIKATYTYSPYGQVTAGGNATQPLQWSSEFTDTDLGLVYYNYRHYNPLDGRWCGRDAEQIPNDANPYAYCTNEPLERIDYRGLCWSAGRALRHYMTFGGDINLDRTGCTSIVTKALLPKMEGYIQKTLKLVNEIQNGELKNAPIYKKKEISNYDTIGAHSGVWWIGNVALDRKYICAIFRCSFGCKFTFHIADVFEKPLDLNNSNSDWWDNVEIGGTFTVSHTWRRNEGKAEIYYLLRI